MPPEHPANRTVIVIDDQENVRHSLRALLETENLAVVEFATAEAFLAGGLPGLAGCLLVDVNMPGMNGLELQEELNRRNIRIPLIVMTGQSDVPRAVRAMKAGAEDFLEKPFDDVALLAAIWRTLDGRKTPGDPTQAREAMALITLLTAREHEVLNRLTLGESNKEIAHQLGISPRTVETHRASIQEKLRARSLADLVRTVRAAGLGA